MDVILIAFLNEEQDKIEAALRKDVNELKIQNGKLEAVSSPMNFNFLI